MSYSRRNESRAELWGAITGLLLLIAMLVCSAAYLLLPAEENTADDSAALTQSPTLAALLATTESPTEVPATATPVPKTSPAERAATPTPSEPAFPSASALIISADKTVANIALENPIANASRYNLKFTLKLKGLDEVLFASPEIAPGGKCGQIVLSRPMQAGDYAAVLSIQPVPLRIDAEQPEAFEQELHLIVS